MPAQVSGTGTVHYGTLTTAVASDDRITVRLLALPDGDLRQDVHVEIVTAERVRPGSFREATTWLSVSEIDELITALTTARATLADTTT